MATAKIAGYKTIPRGYSIKMTPSGTEYIQKKGRGKKRGLSKAVKAKMRIARNRFKIPVLTAAVLTIGLGPGLRKVARGDLEGGAATILGNYTGFDVVNGNWRWERLMRGALPLTVLGIIWKTGIAKGVNTKLTRAKIPLSLS